MKLGGKKGLSPVIATILLVSIALILAIIIFLWARSNIQEQIEKEGQSVELVCDQVSFFAEAFETSSELWIENTGTIALWGVKVRIKKTGEIAGVYEFDGSGGISNTVNAGQTRKIDIGTIASEGDTLIVSPILLGKSVTNRDSVPYVCDSEDYGVETLVGV